MATSPVYPDFAPVAFYAPKTKANERPFLWYDWEDKDSMAGGAEQVHQNDFFKYLADLGKS